jgi:hypothetical protein
VHREMFVAFLERFINRRGVRVDIMALPKRFTDEMRRAELHLDSRERHLILLGFEGLHALERWRTERDYRRQSKPKDI